MRSLAAGNLIKSKLKIRQKCFPELGPRNRLSLISANFNPFDTVGMAVCVRTGVCVCVLGGASFVLLSTQMWCIYICHVYGSEKQVFL